MKVYYDGECPFCSNYVTRLRLKQSAGTLEEVDLRSDSRLRESFRARGLHPDKGIIVETDAVTIGGADAMALLSAMTTTSGAFNRLVAGMMSQRWIARITYPFLRIGRAFALLLLGRSGMDAEHGLRKTPQGFFFFSFGVFGFLHLLVYAFQFGTPINIPTLIIGVSGLCLAFRPLSRRLFLVLFVSLLIDGILQAPLYSNHTIIKNFFVLGIALAGLEALFRGESWSWFVRRFAPLGRWLLLVMYFYGVFHKINSDFLNPEVSCAVTLWEFMPIPGFLRDSAFMHSSGIAGTFVLEAAIVVCLLWPRARHIGIVLGIGFHSLLALSGYAMYSTFSMLTISLHCLFLPDYAQVELKKHPELFDRLKRFRVLPGLLLSLAYAGALAFLGYNGSYSQQGILWLVIPIVLMITINRVMKGATSSRESASRLLNPGWLMGLVTLMFVFNGLTPYLGLKTAQSINMFANLRLEGGVSNHLVMRQPPGPFGYLEDLVEIESHGGVSRFAQAQNEDLRLVYYDFLNEMERSAGPNTLVTFERKGVRYENVSRQDLASAFEESLHPRWFRAWFHFAPVDLETPKPCSLDR